MPDAPLLGLLPPLGGSLGDLARSGQLQRTLDHYLPAYLERFRAVRFFSFERETVAQFTADRDLRRRVDIVALGPPRGHRALRAAWSGAAARRRALRECSIVRAFHTPGALPARVARCRFVCTYGFAYRDFTTVPLNGRLREPALRAKRAMMTPGLRGIISAADAVIATTAETAREAGELGAREIVVIPNGVDLGAFDGAERRHAEFDVVFVGRLVPEKNLGALVGAAAQFPGLRVAVIGDGPERQQLERRLDASGVVATFFGSRPNREVARLLPRARAFVLPSLLEGHPKALIEAMAAGLPCVAMDIPALTELVSAGAVEAASPATPEGLAAAMRRVLGDEAHAAALARRGRALARERFDLRRTLAEEAALLSRRAAPR